MKVDMVADMKADMVADMRVDISAGTLLWIYRRLIGRSYIALARQDQYIGNILDPLGRPRF